MIVNGRFAKLFPLYSHGSNSLFHSSFLFSSFLFVSSSVVASENSLMEVALASPMLVVGCWSMDDKPHSHSHSLSKFSLFSQDSTFKVFTLNLLGMSQSTG